MIKVCAIMAIYNEEDILEEALKNLINDGVDVYIIDNGSTDGSLEIVKSYLNKGVIGMEEITHIEFGKYVYNWTKILQKKQALSYVLDYDWFIHVDADEIRFSPWIGLTLKEGIDFVDSMGFNLINFKLFNFRLFKGIQENSTHQEKMKFYSNSEKFNSMQVKAWKKSNNADLVTHGGHLVIVDNPRLFPIRFLLKHYPVRSSLQAIKKINAERKERFSLEDKAKGWHVQYDSLPLNEDQLINQLYRNIDELIEFKVENETCLIQKEGFYIQYLNFIFNEFIGMSRSSGFWKYFILKLHGLHLEDVDGIVQYHNQLVHKIINIGFADDDYSCLPDNLRPIMISMILIDGLQNYLNGNPFIFDAFTKEFISRNIKCLPWK